MSVCLDDVQEDKTNPIANGSAGEDTEHTHTSENGNAFIKLQHFYVALAASRLLCHASSQIGLSCKAFS